MWEKRAESVVPRLRERLGRVMRLLVCTILGIAAAWRGASFIKPGDQSMVAPILCAGFACCILLTGLVTFCQNDEVEVG